MNEHIVPDASTLTDWRKSSYSGEESGSCIEVSDTHPTAVPVRDSKNPNGPALLIPATAWVAFVNAL
ncbi:DUF397 domain-containing protein [Streptomyces sp. NPDC002054]|uniref:DUF397 domain-containing protein n=1 Tax=Streptomyces sp. NPDC002054 TaxID=3154663 RepID=UPI003319AC48